MDPAAVQVPSEIPRIINDLSPAGRLVPLTPALEEILNADLPSGIVRREALAAVLTILSALKEASETNPPMVGRNAAASEINPLSKKTDPSADLPLEEILNADLPLEETLIVDLPLEETLIVDLPLEETLIVDLPLEETLIVDLPLEETLIVDLPLEETLIVDLPLEETLIVDLPLEETLIVDLPLEETLTADLPLEETLIVDLPLAKILTADPPLAAALRAANVLRVVSEADPSHVKAAHPGRSPVFRIMPVKRHLRAVS